jgi:4-amino-4-deoxy-L-arabinose transferase-like glycosyltransferase
VRRLSPFARRLALVAAGGFVLRVVFALAIAPDSLNHRGDPRFFHLTANLLADGHGYIAPLPFIDSGLSIASTEHPPLWSALLAVFSAVGARSYEAHELVACGVGAATVVCAGLLGRRIGGPRAGLLAACGAALYPVFVAMDGSLMSEPPYALAVAACLVLAFRMVERPSARRGALLGLAIGLAVLVRGEAIGLLVVLLVPVLLQVPRGRRPVYAAAVVGVAAVVIAPWAVRNSVTMDRPVLASTEDGPVIAGANCAFTYRGRDIGYWRSDCLPPGRDRNAAYRSARLRKAGLTYAQDHAGRLPAVLGVRLLRTFGIFQPRRHVFFAEGRVLPGRTFAMVSVWIVLLLGAAGGWSLRRRAGPLAILLAPVVLAVVTSLVAFGYPRFRYAADVSLIVLGAVWLDAVVSARRRQAAGRRRRQLGWSRV